MLVQLHQTYPQDVRLVFRHLPLVSIHANARLAAIASEAAGKQGSFFEMKKLLFERQAEWSGLPDAGFRTWLGAAAEELGLDTQLFASDLNAPQLGSGIDEAYASAAAAGINGTPFLVVNGLPYQGDRSYQTLETILKLYQLTDRQFTECPPLNIKQDGLYTAVIQTSLGDVVVELYPAKAPLAVNSFIFLARQGWFEGNPFYFILPGSYILTGDPTGTGYGSPGYYFDNEITDLRFDKPGVVGAINSSPNTNGSRFFITLSAQPKLDGTYTVFGQVVEGLEILSGLSAYPPDPDDEPVQPVTITRVTIQEQ